MDVSVITVTWNSARFIGEQLASVQQAGEGLSVEQLVVDNGSTDETKKVVTQFPKVQLLSQEKNLGFGAANNLAAAKATGRYFLLLNPDMHLEPSSLKQVVAWADMHPNAGIVGVKLVTAKGVINNNTAPRRFPRVSDELFLNLKISWLFPKLLYRYMARDLDLAKEQIVDSVQGSFMLIRREVYEQLGNRLFDSRYFIWFEDVDLCREVKRLGKEVWYVPSVQSVDYGSQSFKLRRPVWKQKAFIKSQIEYFKKWGPWYGSLVMYATYPFSLLIACVRTLFV